MKNLISVTIDNSPKIHNYIIDKDINIGEKVVVESERGVTVGNVKKAVRIEDDNKIKDIPEIIRIATNKDLMFMETKKELEEEARKYCLERIEYRNMKMKIVDVKYMLHSSKIIFYFTADGRVDFRALVKDLASKLKSRIEMRQIGVRDQAQIVGGIGICGRELCCHTFMNNFLPVSLEDAKQNSSGNSDKLIGVCGRFMCCLKFEENDEICQTCDKNPKNIQDFPVEEVKVETEEELLNAISAKEPEAVNLTENELKNNTSVTEKNKRKYKRNNSSQRNNRNFNKKTSKYGNKNKRNNKKENNTENRKNNKNKYKKNFKKNFKEVKT